jgi:hypothetical protein
METQVVTQVASAYWRGFNLYSDGGQLEECRCLDEQRGWWQALDAASDCETRGAIEKQIHVYTDAELQEMTEELSDYMQDQDFNRRGGWQ